MISLEIKKVANLIFQTLDDKKECVGIYCDNELYFDEVEFPSDLTATWSYAEHLRELDVEYANLYLQGQKVEDVIPEFLADDWSDVTKKLGAFQRSLLLSQVNMMDNCIYDLVPKRFLIDMCEVKNRITKHVLNKVPKPERYQFTLQVCKMLEAIAGEPLKINKKRIKSYSSNKNSSQLQSVLEASPYIKYNQFGTITGRLTTTKGSFPILTLKKSLRDIVEPQNDCFIEMDFNGAEARVMLGLLGKPQPDYDIHQFHAKEVFSAAYGRDKLKQMFFSWLYGAKAIQNTTEGKILDSFYDKEIILSEYWDGNRVRNTYKREIENVDKHHALNYIVQSTAADLTLLQALKIDHFLRINKCKSRICCIIHDSIIMDFSNEDMPYLSAIKKLMKSTKFGDFKINISKGANLGNLKEIL